MQSTRLENVPKEVMWFDWNSGIINNQIQQRRLFNIREVTRCMVWIGRRSIKIKIYIFHKLLFDLRYSTRRS